MIVSLKFNNGNCYILPLRGNDKIDDIKIPNCEISIVEVENGNVLINNKEWITIDSPVTAHSYIADFSNIYIKEEINLTNVIKHNKLINSNIKDFLNELVILPDDNGSIIKLTTFREFSYIEISSLVSYLQFIIKDVINNFGNEIYDSIPDIVFK
mgnify:CR=1 FL=1